MNIQEESVTPVTPSPLNCKPSNCRWSPTPFVNPLSVVPFRINTSALLALADVVLAMVTLVVLWWWAVSKLVWYHSVPVNAKLDILPFMLEFPSSDRGSKPILVSKFFLNPLIIKFKWILFLNFISQKCSVQTSPSKRFLLDETFKSQFYQVFDCVYAGDS